MKDPKKTLNAIRRVLKEDPALALRELFDFGVVDYARAYAAYRSKQMERGPLPVVKWKPYVGPLDQHGLVVLCNIRTGRC